MNTCSEKKKERGNEMYRTKSGLIFKDRIVLTPMYNESHSIMLENMGIKDTKFNAKKVFVKAELHPHSYNLMSDISAWEYVIKQDVVPRWYDKNSGRYEKKFRAEVKEWRDKNIFMICGQPCTKLKEENGNVYYHTCEALFRTGYGDNNNYIESDVRKKLLSCKFVKNLQKEYGDSLVPATMDLAALDGLKDYGKITDIVGIPGIDLYRECRENIFTSVEAWWISTPDSTPYGAGSSNNLYICSNGDVCGDRCFGSWWVRPFFILKS